MLFIIFSVGVALEDVSLADKYAWLQVDKILGNSLLSRISKNMTVPLTVIR